MPKKKGRCWCPEGAVRFTQHMLLSSCAVPLLKGEGQGGALEWSQEKNKPVCEELAKPFRRIKLQGARGRKR